MESYYLPVNALLVITLDLLTTVSLHPVSKITSGLSVRLILFNNKEASWHSSPCQVQGPRSHKLTVSASKGASLRTSECLGPPHKPESQNCGHCCYFRLHFWTKGVSTTPDSESDSRGVCWASQQPLYSPPHPPLTQSRMVSPQLPSHSVLLSFFLKAGRSHQEEGH